MEDNKQEDKTYDCFEISFDAVVSYKSSFYITADISAKELIHLLNTGGAFMSTAFDMTKDNHTGSFISRIAYDENNKPYLEELARVYRQEVDKGSYGEFILNENVTEYI